MLDKKQIQAIFLFKFKMGHKAAETAHNINNIFGPGTANEHTVQWWFKKFCKGDEGLEDEKHSGQPSEVDNDQWRGSLQLILLQLHEKLPKNSTLTILWLFGISSKLESSRNGCLVSWPKINKIVILKCCLSSVQLQWTMSRSSCDMRWKMDCIQLLVTATSVAGQRRSCKALPKAKPAPPKKVMVIVDEVNQKGQRLQTALVNRIGPILLYNNVQPYIAQASKVEWIGLPSSVSSAIFTWPLANWLPLFQASWQLFAGKMLPQLGYRKWFPRVCRIPRHRFLCYRNKQFYFSLTKICWL